MGKQLGIALGLLIALFGVGYLVYGQVFGNPSKATAGASFDAAPTPIDVDAGSNAMPSAERVLVGEITGTLERKVKDGEWQPVVTGDRVDVEDALRTVGEDASAVLIVGTGGTTIELSGEFTVPTLTAKLSTVQVVDGRLAANVESRGDTTLRVEARGADATAETNDGSFSVLSTGSGAVAVASSRGKVAVSAAGKTVQVDQGEQSIVTAGGPPSPPETLPSSLLLKVGKTARELRVKETIVRGTTTPGAIVSVGGIRVQANERGEFETKVALREGRNRLTLMVEDSLGRRQKQTLPPVEVDSTGPKSETKVKW